MVLPAAEVDDARTELQHGAGLETEGPEYLEQLDVLIRACGVGFLIAIVVSSVDRRGQARLEGVAEELGAAAQ